MAIHDLDFWTSRATNTGIKNWLSKFPVFKEKSTSVYTSLAYTEERKIQKTFAVLWMVFSKENASVIVAPSFFLWRQQATERTSIKAASDELSSSSNSKSYIYVVTSYVDQRNQSKEHGVKTLQIFQPQQGRHIRYYRYAFPCRMSRQPTEHTSNPLPILVPLATAYCTFRWWLFM
jgi:hypothetical protein